jgi:hypothetical protein
MATETISWPTDFPELKVFYCSWIYEREDVEMIIYSFEILFGKYIFYAVSEIGFAAKVWNMLRLYEHLYDDFLLT